MIKITLDILDPLYFHKLLGIINLYRQKGACWKFYWDCAEDGLIWGEWTSYTIFPDS